MNNIKNIVKSRVGKLPTPTPSIGIFKGLEPVVFDDGKQEIKKEFYIKLYGKFREGHLKQLKGAPLAVFLCLALHSDERGYSYPSAPLISKETGFGRDSIFKALKYLEGLKFIARIRRRDRKTQKLMSNLYRVFPKSWERKAK